MTAAADTIVAPATAPGRAAIAVVRLSGPHAGPALAALAGRLPAARRASFRPLRDPSGGRLLDQALVLWFPGPGSATGEDCAEFHLHGGRAVVAAVLAAVTALPGCRLARPGEFTRRAFANGRMDLAAVEGVADLVDAETEAQRRLAVRQMEGALGAWVGVQRERLLQALAAAESAIDFADEGDVAGDLAGEAAGQVHALRAAIAAEIDRGRAAERIRDGTVVVLAGPPNAGKSTLLNALARREAAIVSPHPGTTRDPVSVALDLDGQLVELIDTAGLRASSDPVEREGVARAVRRAQAADLVLWLSDARDPCPPDAALAGRPVRIVPTKTDLLPAGAPHPPHGVSALSGAGVPALLAAIAHAGAVTAGGDAVATRLRHREALAAADAALAAAQAAGAALPEAMADDIRRAIATLDALVGRIDTEEVLGAIFARFCIGK